MSLAEARSLERDDAVRASCCLACGSEALRTVLDLGSQPLANQLLDGAEQAFAAYPLALLSCDDCGHGQLSHFVDPDRLFSHYLYASGTSQTLNEYFAWFAEHAARLVAPGGQVLELASNDGSLMVQLRDRGLRVRGVDPARNLVEQARARGLEAVCDFWPTTALGSDRFDLVIAQNVLAHTRTPLPFLTKVAEVLSERGICLVQTSQAGMLSNGEFDTVYHEHASFFTTNSLRALAGRAGLTLQRVCLVDIHGTSFLFMLSRPNHPPALEGAFASGRFAMASDAGALGPELDGSTSELRPAYLRFAERARSRMAEVKRELDQRRAQGDLICLVGAAAKAITFVRAAGIQPDAIFDEAPLKIGRFVPGFARPIAPLAETAGIDRPCTFVLSAWNFRTELERKVRALYTRATPRFLVYFPQIERF
jgi:2-polyprenyl-3-methyl-5-hydroxy-6-metoxy-1,4-benzoquinol methylase